MLISTSLFARFSRPLSGRTPRLGVSALVFAAALTWGQAFSAPVPRSSPFAAEINGFAADDRAAAPPPCALLFVGSSSIGLWETLAKDMAPFPVINRGFGGSYIRNVNAYFDRVVAPYRPRAIIFYAGENDIESGRAPADLADDFALFMRLKTDRLGATPVYFISVKPTKARWSQLAEQTKLNDLIRAIAARRQDLRFIDVGPAMLENGAPKPLFQEDGLHLNAAGYTIWTRAVRDALARPITARAPGCPD